MPQVVLVRLAVTMNLLPDLLDCSLRIRERGGRRAMETGMYRDAFEVILSLKMCECIVDMYTCTGCPKFPLKLEMNWNMIQ